MCMTMLHLDEAPMLQPKKGKSRFLAFWVLLALTAIAATVGAVWEKEIFKFLG